MKVSKLTPNFSVASIRQTVLFYSNVLGFNLVMAVPQSQDGVDTTLAEGKEYVYALMTKDGVELMFQRTDSFAHDVTLATAAPIGASVSFYMEVEGVKDFYADVKSRNLEVTDLKLAWYGMWEFYLRDVNGYILGFAEKAE